MGDRIKFECVCGQHLVARRGMAGTNVNCPSCRRALTVPAGGEEVDEAKYERTERHAVSCPCGYRVLVKAEAAGGKIHCPVCQATIRVPGLEVLRRETTTSLESRSAGRERLNTEDLLLLIDDEEGPGTEVS